MDAKDIDFESLKIDLGSVTKDLRIRFELVLKIPVLNDKITETNLNVCFG